MKSHSRPQTPPTSLARNTGTPPTARSGGTASGISRAQSSIQYPPTGRGRSGGGDDDDPEMEENLEYDDNEEEDEFGLPSITSSRRAARRSPVPDLDPFSQGRWAKGSDPRVLGAEPPGGRARAGSTDISEERGGPTYPNARKSEGKILRPQYKDILKGRGPSVEGGTDGLTCGRSCQLTTSHHPSTSTSRWHGQRARSPFHADLAHQ